jgi:hypothetical protein
MVKKVYKNRKKCIHFIPKTDFNAGYGERECSAKLSTWTCRGVSCGRYKEKTK